MKTVCEALSVARSNISTRMRSIRRAASFQAPLAKPKTGPGRPPARDGEALASIQTILAEQPTYRYWRVWAMLRRKIEAEGGLADQSQARLSHHEGAWAAVAPQPARPRAPP